MAFTSEDLESNSFYMELETKYSEKYKEAQKKLWIICVPCQNSLKGSAITKDFVDRHILKPSPFFKSHFVTTDLNNSLNFEIEDGKIKTPMESISILMEETAYNEDYKPYKIFITEKPLCCSNKDKDEQGCNSNLRKTEKISLNKCTAFLLSFPECLEVMKLLDTRISVFNSSYMILPEYLLDAAIKLQSTINWAVSEFIEFLSYRPVIDYSRNDISAAIENYTMFHVHDKVFPVVKKSCLEEDKKLTQKLLSLYDSHVTPDQLGVQEAFCCQTPSAIVELASLNSRGSPAEKLNCLLSTLEVLNQDVENFLLETCYLVRNRDVPCLTSDDLIPLLAFVIVQSRPQYFISNLQYVQNFCWENSPADKLSFGLVTFQAAKEFLMSNEFEFLKPPSRKMKKELSLEELMEVTVEMQNNSKPSVETKPNKLQSPTDHLLENVTKMIEASTRDLREWTIEKGKRGRESFFMVSLKSNLNVECLFCLLNKFV
ncbi:ankyrin repeat domain-containing protein 27 isoform X2 [Parasteatoda tepidariorum]|uniref:ankyrin repeat domain-containing protein 27 isoform X2 n=1 Tax=Parasteatoda tepidariorum TaxID=114398 RepID=UPI001C71DB8B|nr:ankyrin repeat domain-containing protein 27 isoform X2 [Parasteatoda tepidariorum]